MGRAAVLASVCSGVPLLGHGVGQVLSHAVMIASVAAVLFALTLVQASRRVSFLGLSGTLVAGQLAMHGVLGLALGGPDVVDDWARILHVQSLGWASGAHGVARMLAGDLMIDLAVVLWLYGWERNIWTWFRVAALRLVRPVRALPLVAAPELPEIPAGPDLPPLRALLLVSARGERAPPAPLPA